MIIPGRAPRHGPRRAAAAPGRDLLKMLKPLRLLFFWQLSGERVSRRLADR